MCIKWLGSSVLRLTGKATSLAPLLAASLTSDPALSRLACLLAPTASWMRANLNLRRPEAGGERVVKSSRALFLHSPAYLH